MKLLIILLSYFSVAFGQQKIELISNFPPYTESLSQVVAKYDLIVVPASLHSYKKKLKKKKRSKEIHLAEDVSKIIFWNLKKKQCSLKFDRLPKEKLVLFMWEPPTVIPEMYHKELHKCFSRVYTWDDDLVDNKTYFKFNYPEITPMIKNPVNFKEKKLCVIVCGKHESAHPDELYSARLRVINFFEKNAKNDLDFFGRGWDENSFQSYKGSLGNKLEKIKNYRFSICFENMKNVRGYITEKIFNCFAAGNVPVYLGASNIEKYIPKECFIDIRQFSSDQQLYDFMKNMSENTYKNYIMNIRKFLESDKAKIFSGETFNKIFSEAAIK